MQRSWRKAAALESCVRKSEMAISLQARSLKENMDLEKIVVYRRALKAKANMS